MKTKMLILTLVAVALPGLTAAGDHPGARHGGPPMDELTETLQLDAYQAQQMEQILLEQREKRMALMQEHHEGMREDMRALHDETVSRLRTILGKDQVNQFVELMESKFRGRGGRGQRGERPPRDVDG